MAKVTDPDTLEALQKLSGSHADKLALLKKMKRKASHPGLVQMVFDVTPETKSKLEALASASGMSLSQAAGIILEAQVAQHKKLEEQIRKSVSEAIDAEYTRLEEELSRINAPTETLNRLLLKLFPQLKSHLKKDVTN
jgi:hypothetical protein